MSTVATDTLIHTYEAGEFHERLTNHGQVVDIEAVDQAIQNGCESFRDAEGYWPNKSNDEDWESVLYRALDSLEIDHDLVGM